MGADLILFDDDNKISKELKIKLQKVTLGNEIVLGNVEINRKLIESKKIRILVSPHIGAKKDFLNFRNSGLDDVICRLAKRNKVSIAFSFGEVLNCDGEKRVNILARMRQNVKLCNKYKVNMIIISLASEPYELRGQETFFSFGRVLGIKKVKIGV